MVGVLLKMHMNAGLSRFLIRVVLCLIRVTGFLTNLSLYLCHFICVYPLLCATPFFLCLVIVKSVLKNGSSECRIYAVSRYAPCHIFVLSLST